MPLPAGIVMYAAYIRSMSKGLKILCWVAGVPTALLFLVMALSPVATSVINRRGQDILGRDMSVKHVFVNPFFGTIRMRDFHCKEANGLTDFVAFDKLYVQINWLKLAGMTVDLRHIHLTNFSGEVLSGAKSFNFSDIVTRFTPTDSVPKDTVSSQWTVSLNDIRLINGHLLYHDVVRDNKWSLDNVNLAIPGLYFGPQQSNAGLQFDLPTGGRVTVKAGYVMASRRYALTLQLEDVNTDVALPLVRDYLLVSGLGALINGQLQFNGSLDNVRDVIVSGALSLNGLQVTDDDNDPVAGLDEIRLVIRRGDVAHNNYLLDTLMITGVTGHFERNEKYTTFSRLRREQTLDTIAAEHPTPNDAAFLQWSARYLLLTGYDLSYEDNSMRKNFEYTVNDIRLSGTNVVSQGRNSLRLVAHAADDVSLTATYTGGTNLKQGQHTLDCKLTGVNISDFSPYTEHFFGYPLLNGTLALQSNSVITNGRLNSQNKITVNEPEVGKRKRLTKAQYKNVPLKLGVELLTSAQNIMVLEVPVTGDIASPKFRFDKVVGRAVAKVFFGPLMGVRDNRNLISKDEAAEITEITESLSDSVQ